MMKATPALGNPATRIIARFGGLTRAAQALDKPKSTVQRWQASGYIHPDYYPGILRAAIKAQVRLEVSDFVHVDPAHPAFSEPKTASPDSTAGHAREPSQRPIPGNELSPQLEGCPDRSGADSRDTLSSSPDLSQSTVPAGTEPNL
jgi:hypothetical protein